MNLTESENLSNLYVISMHPVSPEFNYQFNLKSGFAEEECTPLIYGYPSQSLWDVSAVAPKRTAPVYSSFEFLGEDRQLADDKKQLFNGPATEKSKEVFTSGTRSQDVNKANQNDLMFFRRRSDDIVHAIANTDFEDGVDNDVTELIKTFIRRNKIVAYYWMSELYSANMKNKSFVEGLLRVLAIVTDKGDVNGLMPVVLSGLRSKNPAEQEAAIMVIEEWRTKECLDALETSSFGGGWIGEYAEKIKTELRGELG